jgi:hypothetical protein
MDDFDLNWKTEYDDHSGPVEIKLCDEIDIKIKYVLKLLFA